VARALHCKPRGGSFENEIALLVRSNTEFLNQPRTMATWLDIECLYLLSDGAARGLQLLPLVFIGASPVRKERLLFLQPFGEGWRSLCFLPLRGHG
jgi:hypothetical protein